MQIATLPQAAFFTAVLFAGGCSADFLKQVETGAYDAAARTVSEYCERMDSDFATRERTEARREIRQRGTEGPGPVYVEGLDEKTGNGRGPVVRIWCHGETVPAQVWQDLIRD